MRKHQQDGAYFKSLQGLEWKMSEDTQQNPTEMNLDIVPSRPADPLFTSSTGSVLLLNPQPGLGLGNKRSAVLN